MIVAIIPARSGSKRIPGKNIKEFAGVPLILYSIHAAQKTYIFDEIIVSTDSKKIAEIAQQYGASVPFLRPAELSDDHASTAAVLMHTIDYLKSCGKKVEYFCCIYPNPFITPDNLKGAFELLKANEIAGVIPVTSFTSSIFRGMKISSQKKLEFIFPEYANQRTQDIPKTFHDVGQFYWWKCKLFLITGHPSLKDRMPFIIPRYLCQDLDTPEDWEAAERLFRSFDQNCNISRIKKNFFLDVTYPQKWVSATLDDVSLWLTS